MFCRLIAATLGLVCTGITFAFQELCRYFCLKIDNIYISLTHNKICKPSNIPHVAKFEIMLEFDTGIRCDSVYVHTVRVLMKNFSHYKVVPFTEKTMMIKEFSLKDLFKPVLYVCV